MRTNNVDLIYDLQKEKDRAIFKELSLFTKRITIILYQIIS